jgi:hypothetical protein
MKTKKLNKVFDRSVLPVFIVVVTLFCLSSVYNLTLKIDDLIRVDGVVRAIRIEEVRDSRGRINNNFYVYLNSGSKFKIMDGDLFEGYRNSIQRTVHSGDSVAIYRRTQQQTNLGFGTLNLIYQIEFKNQVLMPLDTMHQNFRGLFIFELFLLGGLSTAQIIIIRKRKKDKSID